MDYMIQDHCKEGPLAACAPGDRGKRGIGAHALMLLIALLFGNRVAAETITVAVAANFADTLEVLAAEFEQRSGHQVRLVRGSSGRHFAQIVAGAPFDLFLSADAERPLELIERLQLPADRVKTYANGRLVLWSSSDSSSEFLLNQLNSLDFRILAIANPRLAPYGQAAMEVLRALHLDEALDATSGRLVRGESVAQAFQYVATGNADLGFVALSQVLAAERGSYWLVPEELYQPIVQQLVILTERAPVAQLLSFLDSPPARQIIEEAGYRLLMSE